MRQSLLRHLHLPKSASLQRKAVGDGGPPPDRPFDSESNPLDYLSYLLTIDAQIEHGLMVQYLYSAWSLGGPQVPEDKRELVASWQETMLGIAKEEMGHLISVQNVLRLIGSPLSLGREDYPWDTPFYPFPFILRRADLDTLACYVYAESPPASEWEGPDQDEILRRVGRKVENPHRVGELFELVLSIIKDPDLIPDSAFQADSWPFQADFGEWGRGYNGSSRGGGDNKRPPRADVLVVPVASRDDAVSALQTVADQGEATRAATRAEGESPSHFARFLEVYRGVRQARSEGWKPYRNIAVNPFIPDPTVADPGEDPAQGQHNDQKRQPITHPEAQLWAHLFNVRYRLLLQLLAHSFELAGGLSAAGTYTPRGAIIHATFGEMYNLRALGHILMDTPLKAGGDRRGRMAGPPFQMPYTIDLPLGEANRWRRHRNLLEASATLICKLLAASDSSRHGYLFALRDADKHLSQTIDAVLSGRSRS